MMAAGSMATFCVMRDVRMSAPLLLLRPFRDVEGGRRGSCRMGIVCGGVGRCFTIGLERSSLTSSDAVASWIVSQPLGMQSLSTSRLSLSRRGHVPQGNIATKDFYSLEDGEDAISDSARAGFLVLPALVGFPGEAKGFILGLSITSGELRSSLELGLQLIYLGTLLALLAVGSFLVVRKVLIRRDLESAMQDLQDQVRSGEASSEKFFELGAVMLRKKYYVLANKYLEQAIKKWDGDEADLAQVYNALGFSYFRDNKLDAAIDQYEKAVKLRPGYIMAWYNLGNVYEVKKDFKNALKAYEEALKFNPKNKIARRKRDVMKERVGGFRDIPSKD